MLALSDLENIRSDSSTEDLIKDIGNIKKKIQDGRKERNELNSKIDSLVREIESARRAKEISDTNSIEIVKKLQSIFGNFRNEDEMYAKIRELQDKADAAKAKVHKLTEQLEARDKEVKDANISTIHSVQQLNKEISNVEAQINNVENGIDSLNNQIAAMGNELNSERQFIEHIINCRNASVGTEHFDMEEVLKMVEGNSDQAIMREAKNAAQILGIPFADDLNEFSKEYRTKMNQLKAGYHPSVPIEELAQQIQDVVQRSNELSNENKALKQNIMDLQLIIQDKEGVPQRNLLDNRSKLEELKNQKKKRIEHLNNVLKQAAKMTNSKANTTNKTLSDVCISYKVLGSLYINELSLMKQATSLIDTTELERKVAAVKRQNDILIFNLNKAIL